MEKRVRFQSAWLPWLLIAPQMAIVLVFFFWPAGQAIYQSLLTQDPFGLSTEFVGLENFERLWNDASYLASFKTTARVLRSGGDHRPGHRAAAGGDGQPGAQRRIGLQDPADLALRGGAGGRRRVVAVHVRLAHGRRGLLPPGHGPATGTIC